jgi:Transmembrane secretion effector
VVRRVAVVDVPVDHRPHLFGERLRLALCQPQERAPSTCHVGLAFDTPLAVTFGLVLLLQAGQTVAGPTWQALVPSIADEDEIGRVVSTSQAMTTTVSVAAPAVAGLTVALVGYGAPLLIDAATFVVLGIAGAMIYTGRRAHDAVAGAAAGATDASYSLRTDRCSGRCWLCALVLVGEGDERGGGLPRAWCAWCRTDGVRPRGGHACRGPRRRRDARGSGQVTGCPGATCRARCHRPRLLARGGGIRAARKHARRDGARWRRRGACSVRVTPETTMMATISAVLIVRVRRATVTPPSLAEQAVGAP